MKMTDVGMLLSVVCVIVGLSACAGGDISELEVHEGASSTSRTAAQRHARGEVLDWTACSEAERRGGVCEFALTERVGRATEVVLMTNARCRGESTFCRGGRLARARISTSPTRGGGIATTYFATTGDGRREVELLSVQAQLEDRIFRSSLLDPAGRRLGNFDLAGPADACTFWTGPSGADSAAAGVAGALGRFLPDALLGRKVLRSRDRARLLTASLSGRYLDDALFELLQPLQSLDCAVASEEQPGAADIPTDCGDYYDDSWIITDDGELCHVEYQVSCVGVPGGCSCEAQEVHRDCTDGTDIRVQPETI